MTSERTNGSRWKRRRKPFQYGSKINKLAESKREHAYKLYRNEKFREALAVYNEVIDMCPCTARYYTYRCACYMMLFDYQNAIKDARKCLELTPNNTKAYIYIMQCSLEIGDVFETEIALHKLEELKISTTFVLSELQDLTSLKKFLSKYATAFSQKNYHKAIECINHCCKISPFSDYFKINKAEILAFLTRYEESLEIVNKVLLNNQRNVDAMYVRGICLYYQDSIDQAFKDFQKVLRLDPDHKKAKDVFMKAKKLQLHKDKGDRAFKAQKYDYAYKIYTRALLIDPQNKKVNAKLHFNKAIVSAKLKRFTESVKDCNEALKLDNNYLKAILRKAACHMELKEFQQAIWDYERACHLDKSNEHLLNEAKLAFEKSKNEKKSYYHYNNYSQKEQNQQNSYTNSNKRNYNSEKEQDKKNSNSDYSREENYNSRQGQNQNNDSNSKSSKENNNKNEKSSDETDYYSLLGITKKTSDKEIKKAYYNMAKKYHPDKHPNASEFRKKELEEKFKLIKKAYDVLSDPKQRAEYDKKSQNKSESTSSSTGQSYSSNYTYDYGQNYKNFNFNSNGENYNFGQGYSRSSSDYRYDSYGQNYNNSYGRNRDFRSDNWQDYSNYNFNNSYGGNHNFYREDKTSNQNKRNWYTFRHGKKVWTVVAAVCGGIFLILNFSAVVVLAINTVAYVVYLITKIFTLIIELMIHAIRLCWPVLVSVLVLKISLLILQEALRIFVSASIKAVEFTYSVVTYVTPLCWRVICGFGTFIRSIMSPKFIWQRSECITKVNYSCNKFFRTPAGKRYFPAAAATVSSASRRRRAEK